jgi:hypothetical protein
MWSIHKTMWPPTSVFCLLTPAVGPQIAHGGNPLCDTFNFERRLNVFVGNPKAPSLGPTNELMRTYETLHQWYRFGMSGG